MSCWERRLSAARRPAMETARTLGRADWAFWAAAWEACAAITTDDLPEGDYETLTFTRRSAWTCSRSESSHRNADRQDQVTDAHLDGR